MDDPEIRRLRLQHHSLVRPGFASPAAVVEAFGAMQAQEFAMACWAVGLRSPGHDESTVTAAFDAGQILRTHVLRPTWHFVGPTDLRWLLALSAPRVHALNAYQHRQLGLDPLKLRRCADVIATTLAAGSTLTRGELQVHLTRARLKYTGPALAYVMMYAELEGLICSGPRRGRQFTYALLEKRVPPAPPLDRAEGLARLARKFFATRGPATARDFATWSSLTARDTADAIAALGRDFGIEVAQGKKFYFPTGSSPQRRAEPVTVLLPDYDEYGLSYRDRSAMFASAGAGKLAHNRVVLVDGSVVGSWRRTLGGARFRLDFQLITPLAPRQRKALDAAATRYGLFVGRTRAE